MYMKTTHYYRAIFLSKAVFNLLSACLLVFFLSGYLKLVGVAVMADDALSTLLLYLFALMITLFAGVYAWVGLHLDSPERYALVILGVIAQLGVFLITILSGWYWIYPGLVALCLALLILSMQFYLLIFQGVTPEFNLIRPRLKSL